MTQIALNDYRPLILSALAAVKFGVGKPVPGHPEVTWGDCVLRNMTACFGEDVIDKKAAKIIEDGGILSDPMDPAEVGTALLLLLDPVHAPNTDILLKAVGMFTAALCAQSGMESRDFLSMIDEKAAEQVYGEGKNESIH